MVTEVMKLKDTCSLKENYDKPRQRIKKQTQYFADKGLYSQCESESQSCLTLQPHGLYSPWNSRGQNTGVGSLSFLQGFFEPRSPALQMDTLPAEPQEKPKNTGVGSLSLLQGIFPAQESNWGLLHCRRIFTN